MGKIKEHFHNEIIAGQQYDVEDELDLPHKIQYLGETLSELFVFQAIKPLTYLIGIFWVFISNEKMFIEVPMFRWGLGLILLLGVFSEGVICYLVYKDPDYIRKSKVESGLRRATYAELESELKIRQSTLVNLHSSNA